MTEPARTSPPFGVIVAVLALIVVAALVAVLSRRPAVEAPAPTTLPSSTEGEATTTGQAPSVVEPPTQAGGEAPAPGEPLRGAAAPGVKGGGAAGAPPGPSDRRGTAGAPAVLSAQAMMRRAFVPARSSVENRKDVGDNVSGFDIAGSKGVEVKRAPEIPGRIEFSMEPLRVKPGDKYSLRISLVNEGKKTIEIADVQVRTIVNGRETTQQLRPQVAEVASHQNEIVYELRGAWERTTASWSLEAVIISRRQDVYRNRVTWK
jgi:hypothetical protein